MNAVVRRARDVGPVQERYIPIIVGDQTIEATVRYQVSYQSIFHRGYGLDPDIEIISATYLEGVETMPLAPRFHDLIVDHIAADEMELN